MTAASRPDIEIPDAMNDSPVSHVLSMFWDGRDPWGSAMAEGFALCDFLAGHLGEPELIPNEMGYRMGMGGPDYEDARYELLIGCYPGHFTAEDIAAYLIVLHSFLDECKRLGLDY